MSLSNLEQTGRLHWPGFAKDAEPSDGRINLFDEFEVLANQSA